MKTTLLFIAIILTTGKTFAQQSIDLKNQFYQDEWKSNKDFQEEEYRLVTDESIDIKFYHLDLSVAVDSQFISGNVFIRLEPVVSNLNKVKLNLHSSMKVDSVTLNCISFSTANDEIEINLNRSYNPGEVVELKIFYHGKPVLAGGYKGLVYTTHGAGEPLIVTLSTPFLAHYWYPCKDGPKDKADSVYMDITVKDTIVNGIQLIAVSNGVLESIDSTVTDKRTFGWRHRYPIVPYYVMIAISNYRTIQQTYTGTTSSFPLIYYVFNENYNTSVTGVNQLHSVFDRFSQLFGDYPFAKEKYGITEIGFYGGIENQTNTIQNNMSPASFYISTHELAHEWFADMITCADWHHGWLNEGFASYSEALIAEYLNGKNAYKDYMAKFEYYQGGTVYLPSDTDAFNIFQAIIYYKGAYVLHMLRGELGDSVFFKCLYDYSMNPSFRYANATTEDFKQICENVSGKNLDTFFQQWIYDEYYPVYKYNFSSSPSKKETILTIKQDQGALYGWRPVFEMPLQIRFSFLSGKDTTVTVWNNLQFQSYEFEFSDSVTSVTVDPEKWILKKASYDAGILVSASAFSYENEFAVFPNPADDRITLMLNCNTSTVLHCVIRNILGKRVRDYKFSTKDSGNSITLDISSLERGIYLLTIAGREKVVKIVKL